MEPAIIFEGNHYLNRKVHHILVQADLDARGRRSGMAVSATSLDMRTYAAFFSAGEIQTLLGMGPDVPSARIVDEMLPRLKRVARTLIISEKPIADNRNESRYVCIRIEGTQLGSVNLLVS